MLWFQNIPELWIYLGSKYVSVRQGFEQNISWYMLDSIMNIPWILNIPESRICKVYTRFWIKFSIIDIWQGSEYASNCEYASITQSSVENGPSYYSDYQYARAWMYTRYVNMSRFYKLLCKLYFKDS